MYFPASAAIATSHSALAGAIKELDRLIYQTGDHPLRVPSTADFLGISLPVLERLLAQFEQHSLLHREERHFCRVCDWLLDENDEGLWCDNCERTFESLATHKEEVFAPVDPIVRVEFEPEETDSAESPTVIQFIAGDRGGPRDAQVQAPREHREIRDAIAAGRFSNHISMVNAIHAATANEIATSYTESPDVLHFAGHGNDRTLSIIRDRGALVQARPLMGDDLRSMLENFPHRVRICMFNTCESSRLAADLAAAAVVDVAIGWDGKVDDNAAIDFATGFYRHLAEGLSIHNAFHLARASTERGVNDVHLHHAVDVVPRSFFIVGS